MTQGSFSPSEREFMLNFGNRWAVFGPKATLPRKALFGPEHATPTRRITDERENVEGRFVESLRVTGADAKPDPSGKADLEITDREGKRTLVELKVRDHEPNKADLDQVLESLKSLGDNETKVEVWVLNFERMKLHVFTKGDRPAFDHFEYTPINVWEYDQDGSVFDRSKVFNGLNDWSNRIDALYDRVGNWSSSLTGLKVERTRTIEMSEDLMQRYAIPDRELPILDVRRGAEPIVSFVPRGLWIIGAKGRIDVITSKKTHILVDLGFEGEAKWKMVDPENRRRHIDFDESVFKNLIGEA
jgi:hypothetical protein